MKQKQDFPEIGSYGFVIGKRQIQQQKWNESFPQNLFGKVITFQTILKCNYIILRLYRPRSSRYKGERHPHQKCELKYFQLLTK